MGTEYSKSDAGRDTDSSAKEVSSAWHDAREDAQRSGELPERAVNKVDKERGSSESDSNSSGK